MAARGDEQPGISTGTLRSADSPAVCWHYNFSREKTQLDLGPPQSSRLQSPGSLAIPADSHSARGTAAHDGAHLRVAYREMGKRRQSGRPRWTLRISAPGRCLVRRMEGCQSAATRRPGRLLVDAFRASIVLASEK